MTVLELLDVLKGSPLIVSVQASEGSPVDDPAILTRLAEASVEQGAKMLRLQGIANIEGVREGTGAPSIGLLKKRYPDSEVYITPTLAEVDALLATDCEVVALDGTARQRPGGESLRSLVQRVHQAGRLVMADCDTVTSIRHAESAGVDLVGTTLAGYTRESEATSGPDLEFLRKALEAASVPVIAEGRFSEPWQVQAALRIGAKAVVIGGAINDPVKQTRIFLDATKSASGPVGAVDIGGTWLRFGLFSSHWELLDVRKISLPIDRSSRMDWIREQIELTGAHRVGVGTGGTVDPTTGEVWEAKPLIPGHQGSTFDQKTLGVPVVALNDGLATAWGHACHPRFAGRSVATLALGTGVGCGFVQRGRILMGPRGEYPRLNDIPTGQTFEGIGLSFEALLGGASLTPEPTPEQKRDALQAFLQAALMLQELYFPDEIVVSGGVGLSEWLAPFLTNKGLGATPFGAEAGLYGAAALALFPPPQLS